MAIIKLTLTWDEFQQMKQLTSQFYGLTSNLSFLVNYEDYKGSIPPETVQLWASTEIGELFAETTICCYFQKAGIDMCGQQSILSAVQGVYMCYLAKSILEKAYADENSFNWDIDHFYRDRIEDELIRLYRFCVSMQKKRHTEQRIELISQTSEKIVLNNYDNYLCRALKKYCEEHVPNVQMKYKALKNKKGGRPQDDKFITDVMVGTYKLLKQFSRETTAISNGICRFIYRLIRCFDSSFYQFQEEKMAIKSIRTRLNHALSIAIEPSLDLYRPCSLEDLGKVPLKEYEDLYS